MTFTRVCIIVAITAVVFYFGLNLLFPRSQTEQKSAGSVTPDQVFGSNTASTPAPPPSAPAPAASTPSAEQQAAAVAPASSASVPPPAAATVASAASNSGSSSASAAAAEPSAPASGSSTATAEQAPAEAAPAAAPAASEPAPAAAAAEPAPAAPAAAETAASETAPAAAPPAPKKSKHAASAVASTSTAPATAGSRHAGQESLDAISVWWPAVGQQKDSQLNLLYAGEAAFDKAAVLLFSDNIGDAAASHIQILDDHGKPAAGHWRVSPQNSRMLIFKTRPGRYTLVLAPDLAGQSGKTLGTGLHGPVYVH